MMDGRPRAMRIGACLSSFTLFCFHLFPIDWFLHPMLKKSQDADDFPVRDIFLWPISGTAAV